MPDRTLTITAHIGSLGAATEFVRKGAREAGLTEERTSELDLAVEEIFVNVSRYAYGQGPAGPVEITYRVPSHGGLEVEFADQGRAFDPLTVAPPHLDDNLSHRDIGGLGIFLVKSLASSLTYRRENGWNRLTFAIS